jgi:hypothetical protein
MYQQTRYMLEQFIAFLCGLLLRFYNEIIVGVWAIVISIPLDAYLYEIFDGVPSYNLTKSYFIFTFVYTVIFIILTSLVPYIKELIVRKEIDYLANRNRITVSQTEKIHRVLDGVLIHKTIFSREGFLQFLMTNLFSVGVIFAYFGIEGVIMNTLQDKNIVVPCIFIFLFVLLLTLESFLDDYLSDKIRNNRRLKTQHVHFNNMYGPNRKLLMLILRNLGGGGSLSAKLSQLLVEDAVDDIYEILTISRSMEYAKNKKHKRVIKRTQKDGDVRVIGYKSSKRNIKSKIDKIKRYRVKYKTKRNIQK